MIRQMTKIGNSKGLVLSKDVRDYMGLTSDDLELTLEGGKVILSAPLRRQCFEQALADTLEQFDEAFTNLAK